MPELLEIEPGRGRGILVVTAHADDAALFIGGTIARWSATGWRVTVMRVTDDRWDSVGLDEAATMAANAAEFAAAMNVLGVTETIELGWPTDTLGDASEVALRERIIHAVRRLRPYALVSFDGVSGPGEDNQDHVVVAQATDEAAWTSQFDLHHPEHRDDGLVPHGVFERWWFGRPVIDATHLVDISGVLDTVVEAGCCHVTPLRNLLNQLRLQAETGGWRLPAVDEALATGDIVELLDPLLRGRFESSGEPYGTGPVDAFRIERFSGLEALLEIFGERIDPS